MTRVILEAGVKRTSQRPVIITDAEKARDEQLRDRQIRYAVMMGVRLICLIVAAVLVGVGAPLLWLWLPLCLVGMVLLPWMAVIIANDQPPKEEYRLWNRLRHARRPHQMPPRSLGSRPDSPSGRVIDMEP